MQRDLFALPEWFSKSLSLSILLTAWARHQTTRFVEGGGGSRHGAANTWRRTVHTCVRVMGHDTTDTMNADKSSRYETLINITIRTE